MISDSSTAATLTYREKLNWYPTKFIESKGEWIANPNEVKPSSRLTANLMLQNYVRVLRTYGKGDLVDLGCGNAPLYGVYGPLTDRVIWTDWEQSKHAVFEKDLILDLNKPLDQIEDNSFDTVLLSDVLEHLVYPDNLIREIHRILRPHGVVLIGVPFMYWIHEPPHDFHRFTKFKLERFGSDAGFEVVEITETGGGWDVFHDLLMKLLFSHKKPSSLWANRVYRFLLWVRRRTARSKNYQKLTKLFPLGYIAVFKKTSV